MKSLKHLSDFLNIPYENSYFLELNLKKNLQQYSKGNFHFYYFILLKI